jgi:hypothetical protein
MLQGLAQLAGAAGIGMSGMIPLGMGRQNMYDRLRDHGLTQLREDMIRQVAPMQQENYFRTIRGGFSMMGIPFGEEQQQMAGKFASLLSHPWISSAAVQTPEGANILDVLGGRRGSPLALAEYAFRGGRHRIDPLTGRSGLSADSTGQLIGDIRKGMFPDDPRDAIAETSGLTQGTMGQLFADMQRRGMMPGTTGIRGLYDLPQLGREGDEEYDVTRSRHIKRFEDAIKERYAIEEERGGPPVPLTAEGDIDLDAVDRDRSMRDRLMESGEMQTAVKELDSRKVIQTLENYSGSIKAMKEIFGDAGHPDAPVPELINALNTLTGNALSQMDPSKVEMMVRTTYALAEATGVGLPGMMAMTQVAGDEARKLGLNPIFAAQAVQGALAFGQAAQETGLNRYTAWDRGTPEELQARERQMRLLAASSAASNRFGAAMRLQQATPDGLAGTPIQQWLDQIRAGAQEVTIRGDDGQIIHQGGAELNDRAFLKIAGASGIDAATATAFMGQKNQNLRLSAEEGAMSFFRDLQTNEARYNLAVGSRWALATRASSLGGVFDERDRRGNVTAASREARTRLSNMLGAAVGRTIGTEEFTQEIATDPEKRREFWAGKMEDRLRAAAADPRDPAHAEAQQVMAMGAADREEWLSVTAESIYGSFDQRMQKTIHEGAQGVFVATDYKMRERKRASEDKAAVRGQVTRAMAPLGGGSPLQRFISSIQDAPDTPGGILRALSGAVGGENPTRAAEQILEPVKKLREAREEMKKALLAYEDADDDTREEMKRRLEERIRAVDEETANVEEAAEAAGVDLTGPAISDADLRAAADDTSEAMMGLLDKEERREFYEAAAKTGPDDITDWLTMPEREFQKKIAGEREAGTVDDDDIAKIQEARSATAFRLREEIKRKREIEAETKRLTGMQYGEEEAREMAEGLHPVVDRGGTGPGDIPPADEDMQKLDELTDRMATAAPQTVEEEGRNVTIRMDVAKLNVNGLDVGPGSLAGDGEETRGAGDPEANATGTVG